MVFWATINILISMLMFYLIRSPLMRAYLVVNYILIMNPVFMWVFFEIAHPKFMPGRDSYVIALQFMAAYNVVLCVGFYSWMHSLPRSRLVHRTVVKHRLNTHENTGALLMVVLLTMAIGFVGKFGLEASGAFRMGEAGNRGEGPWLQALKVFAGFDLLAVILLGEMRQMPGRRSPLFDLTLPALVAFSLAAALFTGSRAQTVTVLIIAMLAYRDVVRRWAIVVYPALAAVIPSLFLLFPLLSYYRGNKYSFTEASYLLDASTASARDVLAEVIVTRLNYLEPIARAVNYVESGGAAGGAVYWNNIIGVIPRLIWPDKPEVSNESRELGHQLDLVTRDDTATSIGLQVVGEAFYEYGWLGLCVAVFQALIFVLIHKNFFLPGNPAAMTVYIYSAFYILQRDGYFAVVPGLIWLAIGFFFFFLAFQLLLPRSRSPRPTHEALPHRPTYR